MSRAFTSRLEDWGVAISMDGRGRALDNVFVERLWWSVKYESIYLHEFGAVPALEQGLQTYFNFYCYERPHQALDYRTPAQVYRRRTPRTCSNAGCAISLIETRLKLSAPLPPPRGPAALRPREA